MTRTHKSSPSELVSSLETGHTIVTATRRLARELHREYQIYQAERGKPAWETPDIIPYEPWLKRQWHQIKPGKNAPVVLNDQQSEKIWTEIIQTDLAKSAPETAPLWNTQAAAKQAMAAWDLLQLWDIPLSKCAQSWLEDHRIFAKWATQFADTCRDNGWLDNSRLHAAVSAQYASADPPCKSVMLAGFDLLTPAHHRLSANLEALGCRVTRIHFDLNHGAPRSYRSFSVEDDQWLAAARWARDIIEQDNESRVGIIVPDLTRTKDSIHRAFAQVLNPESLFENDTQNLAFHLSLGSALADCPVVDAALTILSMVSNMRMATTSLSNLLLSRYLGNSIAERSARAILETQCRKHLPFEIDSASLLSILGSLTAFDNTPSLRKGLETVAALRPQEAEIRTYSHWGNMIAQVLAGLGWPGETSPGSNEHQAIESFRDRLDNLRSLDLVQPGTTFSNACSELLYLVRGQLFQPESPAAAVEILGVNESAGLGFDALWFANQNTGVWPGDLAVNPFIPPSVQAAAEIPAANHHRNMELCQDITNQRAGMGRQIVFSRPHLENGVEKQAGKFFTEPPTVSHAPPTLISQLQARPVKLEILSADPGTPFGSGLAGGGAGVIASQSACAFRAYAQYRLGAGFVSHREPGLDSLDRGNLAHKVLELFWREVPDRDSLRKLSAEQQRTKIKEIADPAIRKLTRQSGLGEGYGQSLLTWITRTLEQWLELESQRKNFVVAAREYPVDLVLDDLVLRFRIDRVDRLDDGSLALLDYKTGETPPVTRWLGEAPDYRSEYPQLGLYALAAGQSTEPVLEGDIEALLVAKLKLGSQRFSGFSIANRLFEDDATAKGQPPTLQKVPKLAEPFRQWQSLRNHWNDSFSSLARDFVEGQASVDPLPSACQYCDLHSLCRIQEQQSGAAEDE